MWKYAIWLVVALVNAVAFVCAVNPWTDRWQSAGIAFLAVESLLTIIVYLPMVMYHKFARKRSWFESFTVATDSLLDIITGVVP